jgi:hypothetical protein
MDLVENQGMRVLSARNVAKQLTSSTAPVYSGFSSIDELKREVLNKSEVLLIAYIKTPYTDRVFLNMGVGIALFSRDQRELYRTLFLKKNEFKDIVDGFLSTMKDRIREDHRFTKMPVEGRNSMVDKMWIFAHGLATLICVGFIDGDS